jgi:putative two-component system response regulator
MMPGMDGYEVLARLRGRTRATRDIPVIFLTALRRRATRSAASKLGAADYITKPIKPAVVLARVRTSWLEARARLAEGPERPSSKPRWRAAWPRTS